MDIIYFIGIMKKKILDSLHHYFSHEYFNLTDNTVFYLMIQYIYFYDKDNKCNTIVKHLVDNSSIYSVNPQTAQTFTYYHSPGNNHTPKNPTSNVTVIGNAGVNPCASTFCLHGGNGTEKSMTDSLEQYKSMQTQYDNLVAQLDENPEALQEILLLSDAMRKMSDHAISKILQDSILYLENLKQWYEVVRTPIAKYSLAETFVYERNYDQAENVLKEIPTLFTFNDLEMKEHENYMQFYNFKKQMYLSERNWTQLNESEIAQLQTIAEATQGRSAGMAKGVLCFFYDICYEDDSKDARQCVSDERKERQCVSGSKDAQSCVSTIPTYDLSLYPNPTQSEMTISTNNPAVKIMKMEVYDVYGKNVSLQTENKSYDTLKMNELANGVYILKV